MTKTNRENLTLENYENEFLYKENKSNLNISFNRIAFIFFIFIMICFIYSLKVFYLGRGVCNSFAHVFVHGFGVQRYIRT